MIDDESPDVARWFGVGPLPGPLDSPPPSAHVEVRFGAQSRPGGQRSSNHDHHLILRLGRYEETILTSLPTGAVPGRFDECGYGMIVASGIGGGGEAASRLAVATLVHLAVYFGRWHLRVDESIAEEITDRGERFYRSIDSTLLRATRQGSGNLQTTLTAVFTTGTELFFAHVGHSRAYMFRDSQLMQLTRDQVAGQGRRPGATVMDLPQGTPRPRRVVTETLGEPGSGAPRIDVERCGLLDGDVILLCTDGLTSVADDGRVAATLRAHSTPDDQCRALMDLVARADGATDATAVVAHYRIGA